MIQILQIASGNFFSTYGGGQVYVKNIVDEMIRQGYSVQVISFVNKDCAVETRDYKGTMLYEVGSNGIDRLESLIVQIRPDVIHAHSHKAQVVEIGKKQHIPVIVTAHHGGIVCPAGTLLDCKDEICHIAVSHEHCLACCLRNIRSGKYWYPFMRLLPQNVYRSLDNENAELHLIGGVGNKSERRYEHSLKRRYAADKRVVWHGKVPPEKVFDMIRLYHISSSSSYLEAFGLNIAESLAMGKPVLATRCGGAEMQIEDGVNGWLVEPNNVDALAEKMQEISNNFVHYDTYLSTERVISIEDHCKSLCQIYKDIENTYEA